MTIKLPLFLAGFFDDGSGSSGDICLNECSASEAGRGLVSLTQKLFTMACPSPLKLVNVARGLAVEPLLGSQEGANSACQLVPTSHPYNSANGLLPEIDEDCLSAGLGMLGTVAGMDDL